MIIQEHKHPNFKKELGEREVEINWITFRSNPLDEYWTLADRNIRGDNHRVDLPDNVGYIFTPWGAYRVEPEYVYRVEDKGMLSDRRVNKADCEFFTYDQIKKNPITDLIMEVKDKRFKNWSADKYTKGNCIVRSIGKKKILYIIMSQEV